MTRRRVGGIIYQEENSLVLGVFKSLKSPVFFPIIMKHPYPITFDITTMADTLSLQGKVAIVTGSGRENGIGAGIALALARNGASVIVNYVSDSTKDRAEVVCNRLREAGGQAIAIQASVDTKEGAEYLVNKTLEVFKTDHIDILGELTIRSFVGGSNWY